MRATTTMSAVSTSNAAVPTTFTNIARSDFCERPGAVAELLVFLGRNTRALEQRDENVRVRRVLLVVDVLVALHAAAASEDRLGQRVAVVRVAVCHVAA